MLAAVITVIAAFTFGATPARAQSGGPDPGRLPRLYASASVGFLTDDTVDRGRLFSTPRLVGSLVEGGAAVTRRIGVGVEVGFPPSIVGETRGISFRSSGEQRERTLVGLVRGRIVSSDRIAFDAVGGAGLLFQHHEQRLSPCFSGCPDIVDETLDRRAPAFAGGAEVPIRIASHLSLVPIIHAYVLRRGEHRTTVPTQPIPWQYEWSSSTRLFVGGNATIGW